MVSEKMRELGTKKSTIREIFEYGRKRAQEVGEENICDFSLGNPNVPAPDFIKQAVLAIMTEMATPSRRAIPPCAKRSPRVSTSASARTFRAGTSS